jgi:hypothetical protein
MLTATDAARAVHPRTPLPVGRAALQHNPVIVLPLRRAHEPAPASDPVPHVPTPKREVFIQGLTLDGRTFRPSDWAERLAGAMSSFRPGGTPPGRMGHIGYSPYCVPNVIHGIKCVVVNEALREVEPMAWDFVMSFAKDNRLQVADACLLPDPPADAPRP